MNVFDRAYREAQNTPSDINEHASTLRELASLCRTVTEFGVRSGVSTTAFMTGLPTGGRLISYDINPIPEHLKTLASLRPAIKFIPIQADTMKCDLIEPTDLLFIDTLHTYDQVMVELEHAPMAKWIAFHDTISFPGILPAIATMLEKTDPEWDIAFHHRHNNGLMLIQREDEPGVPMKMAGF